MYPFPNIESARDFARLVAMEMKAMDNEPEYISFAEIRERKQVSQDTVRRWLDKLHIKAHNYAGGKGIRSKDYYKLP